MEEKKPLVLNPSNKEVLQHKLWRQEHMILMEFNTQTPVYPENRVGKEEGLVHSHRYFGFTSSQKYNHCA